MSKRNRKTRHRKNTKRRVKPKQPPAQPPLQQPSVGEQHQAIQQALGLAVQHHTAGDLPKAEGMYQQVLQADPNQPDALHLLGVIAHQVGKNDKAVELISKAIAVKPDLAEAHSNLGITLKKLGRLEEAVTSYHKALAIKPNYADAHYNLGNALRELRRLEDAVASSRRAIALNPQNEQLWDGFAQCLRNVAFTSVDDRLLQDLLHLLERPLVGVKYLVPPIISALRQHADFTRCLALMSIDQPEEEISYGDAAEALSAIPLFLRLMELAPIHDVEVEAMLTSLRRAMIRETLTGRDSPKGLPFSIALALHCFTNEYVFYETAEDPVAVERLHQQIAALIENDQEVPPFYLIALATYRPLGCFPWARKLLERDWEDDINQVLVQQIREPEEERSLRSQIPCLTSIEDTISQTVRDQYEENPYPRWVKARVHSKARTIVDVLRNSLSSVDLGDYESPESPEILIAGCGTGQHSLEVASCYSNSRIVAVDLSLSSLAYAVRKTRKLGLSNIEYFQADILELDQLGRQFDLIECLGVLHHLGDPLAGWQVLVNILRPNGLMRIGLYSEIARQSVVKGREFIAEKGYTTSAEDIRQCRRDILSTNRDSEISKLIHFWDFFSLSDCRDLLFHVQEHRFTLLQIEEALKSLGLKFLGFTTENQRVRKMLDTFSLENQTPTSFTRCHEFELENPRTFTSMYQFWCQKM